MYQPITGTEHLSMLGMIPIIVKLAGQPDSEGRVRLEAAKVIDHICQHNNLTLQMFIGCGGLPLIVHLMSLCTEIRCNETHTQLAHTHN